MRRLWFSAVVLAWLSACEGGLTSTMDSGSSQLDAGPLCDAPDDDAGVFDDVLPPTRLLRRASMALRGVPPTDAEYAALIAAGDEAAQRAHVATFIDEVLASPDFYRSMFALGSEWLNVPLAPPTADEPEYGPQQQRALSRCESTTPNAGKWAYVREDYEGGKARICNGQTRDGGVPAERTLEPWWAPGTMATLVGSAAREDDAGITNINGNWTPIDCAGRPDGTCGCGPHGINCHADFETYPGHENYVFWNPKGQRRQLAEEPARLFAHLAWHDRPLTELIAGTKSVGTTNSIAAYVMQGLESGDLTMLGDDSWWQPSKYAAAPVDPEHVAGDPNAWREFDVPALSRVFIADRDYTYDPRSTQLPMKGLPAAGMLTSIGFLAGQPRERLRAARALEILGCEVLAPPSGQTFNPYVSDPAAEGPCQHCHRRIDPAAIHFKRYAKQGSASEGYGAQYLMPAIGGWRWPARWRQAQYPYGGEPFSHWNRWYTAGTKMTPVTQAQVDADPLVVFIDFLPPDQTLLGQVSDGTVGPLGFSKLLIASGGFDRCVVRKLHTQVMGRDIDPALETGYLDLLTARFVAGGRKVRPFIKELTTSDLFGRGL
jgi:hypothetical protein